MLEPVLIFIGQFTIALFIRLAWHKYTDEVVRTINPFIIIMLIILQLYFAGIQYLSFILGLFMVDFAYQYGERNNKQKEVKRIIAKIVSWMPDKKENHEEGDGNNPEK